MTLKKTGNPCELTIYSNFHGPFGLKNIALIELPICHLQLYIQMYFHQKILQPGSRHFNPFQLASIKLICNSALSMWCAGWPKNLQEVGKCVKVWPIFTKFEHFFECLISLLLKKPIAQFTKFICSSSQSWENNSSDTLALTNPMQHRQAKRDKKSVRSTVPIQHNLFVWLWWTIIE